MNAPFPATRPVARIVVPVGGTDDEYLAQEQAVQFAAALDVPVHAIHVAAYPEAADDRMFHFLRQATKKWGVELKPCIALGTSPAEALLAELDSLDLVVVGSRRLGTRFHIGSVAERLIKESPAPVQVVRLGRA